MDLIIIFIFATLSFIFFTFINKKITFINNKLKDINIKLNKWDKSTKKKLKISYFISIVLICGSPDSSVYAMIIKSILYGFLYSILYLCFDENVK